MTSGASSQRLKVLETREISDDEAAAVVMRRIAARDLVETPSEPEPTQDAQPSSSPPPAPAAAPSPQAQPTTSPPSGTESTLTAPQMAQLRLIDAQIKKEQALIEYHRTINTKMLGTLKAVAMILSGKVLLLLSLLGAFVLGTMAISVQSWISVVALTMYGLLTVCPLVCLEMFGGRPSGPSAGG